MSIMIMAGGTGGHVYPALTIAESLRNNQIQVYWLGARGGLEEKLVPENAIEIDWINIEGVRGKGLLNWIKLPFKLTKAVIQAFKILNKRKPSVVLCMGGFVAGPGGIASIIKRIPLIIHESNAIAGMTNRVLSKFANITMCALPNTKDLSGNIQVVGNPVRENIINLFEHPRHYGEKEYPLRLLIVGGSQGALSINKTLPQACALLDQSLKPSIRHQTGKDKFQAVKLAYENKNIDADVRDYIEDMAESYRWADIIICRAGAMTLSEVAIAGLPAIVIPYPYSAGDHQLFNAQYLVEHNAVNLLVNQELTAEKLASQLTQLMADKSRLQQMSDNLRALCEVNAVNNILKYVRRTINA